MTLGSVQSIVEDGGSIECTGGEESSYVEYEGEQPDFGSPPSSIAVAPRAAAEPAAAPAESRKPALEAPQEARRRAKQGERRRSARSARTVSLAYAIS